jgi:HAD superfamily hydrolase (TIGR01484 family)
MKYKALVMDVDGTLIASGNALPSQKVKKAILDLKGKGIHISIATARPYDNIKKICEELQLSGFSIVSGGAQLVDVETGKYYYEYSLDHEFTLKACSVIRNFNSGIRLWIQDDGVDHEFGEFYKPNKPFVIVAYALTAKMADEVIQELSGLQGLFYTKVSSLEEGFIDILITHEKATKQHGIETIAKILGISKDEIIGIGDGYNDYSLLNGSGLKVAMGNAIKEIKEIADYIAPSVDEDGVAAVISKYL